MGKRKNAWENNRRVRLINLHVERLTSLGSFYTGPGPVHTLVHVPGGVFPLYHTVKPLPGRGTV